ncbi:hypothetical protein EQF93_07720 [Helcococcus ovis]|uniref:hypothetical protein n=1 Tax=Helcococcus ovis TaxID=72026 RepID=UPI00106FD2EA|nr:hypothetical protein [Helcococcus ovis]TFF65978.1 hypothetical protein EQF93_07720 [Helcococcus ovis]WNZ01250.1 hypothetical protein EQF90_008260 [Helcococcus ovis]
MDIKSLSLRFIKYIYISVVSFLAGVYIYDVMTGEIKTSLYDLLPYFFVLVFASLIQVIRDREKK